MQRNTLHYKLRTLGIILVFSILCGCSSFSSSSITESHPENSFSDAQSLESSDSNDSSGSSDFSLSLDKIPQYNGSPFAAVNDNLPLFSENDLTTDAFENYSPLDSLGRCGVAYANICKEIMPTEKRGEIGQVRPSGWQTVKYNDLIDGNYLYNRCHLIGYQLAGENANERNLITGTRYMNVVGMLPFEDKVDDYVERTNNHVLYRVTPVFDGNNLVASGVLMEAFSVEDNGKGICFNVFCYNVQPNITIDYLTGESHAANSSEVSESTTSPQIYILNTNRKKFHYPSCRSVSQMADHNKKEFSGTRDEVINMGYSPCENCHPYQWVSSSTPNSR